MSNKSDLIELRDSVKAGFWDGSNYFHTIDDNLGALSFAAYMGSADAGIVLLKQTFPNWIYNLAPGFCHIFPPHDNGDQESYTGVATKPGRAILLAILEVLIGEFAMLEALDGVQNESTR